MADKKGKERQDGLVRKVEFPKVLSGWGRQVDRCFLFGHKTNEHQDNEAFVKGGFQEALRDIHLGDNTGTENTLGEGMGLFFVPRKPGQDNTRKNGVRDHIRS